MSLLDWLLGTSTTKTDGTTTTIDPVEIAQLGALGLAFYAGYRVIKKMTEPREER